jgi:hypothetical protein
MGWALRLRWSWLKRTDPFKCWADLPAGSEKRVVTMFEASLLVLVGDGKATLFWSDRWLDGATIKELALDLFQAIPTRCRNSRTVSDALAGRSWTRDIKGALTVSLLAQYLRLWDRLQNVHLNTEERDRFIWKWSGSGEYSASCAYCAFFHGRTYLPGGKALWKTRAPAKCKFFFWLAIYKRCWTSEHLLRHGLPNHGNCAL